jgi:hypothetical protein
MIGVVSSPGARRLSTVLLIPSALAVVGADVLLGVAVDDGGRGAADRADHLFAFFTPGFAIPGAILARGRPAVPIGWLFLVAALACALAGCGAVGVGHGMGWREPLPENSESAVRNTPETSDGHTDQRPTRLVTYPDQKEDCMRRGPRS